MSLQLEAGTVEVTNLSHLGIAVKDADATAKFISSVWNIGAPEVVTYEPTSDEMLVGDPFRVKLIFIKFGTLTLEFLQPLDDGSIWATFIEKNGEGIHHIAFGVSNYDDMLAKLQDQGHPLLLEAVYDGCRWCYFDTSPGGMLLEFREEYKK